eukprot:TRINITY_DN9404_c0_g1_i1.p1 TRINITY_DN9404_c0_g1~~TRINITY_DN9404_c0_g1_i1.p1  ORF type:complete len:180 (-),score=60.50 TRINITY_DN9404_c0_g1_i1:43-582(-)
MGNLESSNLTEEEIQLLKEESSFSDEELRKLHRRFKKLDVDGSGTLTIDEFMKIPDLAMNPLLERILQIFDENKDNAIQFTEFITALSTFSKGDETAKLRFAFRVYDIDNDGYISNGELFQVLKMMVGNNLNDIQLQQIVDKTIIEGDKDGDGRISFDEFLAMVGNVDDINEKMTLNLS